MLNLDWATIVFQAANFLVLAVALYYLVFRPLMARVRERRAERMAMTEQIREDRRQAERLRDNLEAQLGEAEAEAEEIIREAQIRAEAERHEMLEEVEQDIEEMLVDTREDVRQLRQQAVDEFHNELIDAILDVCARVIGQVAPRQVHDSLLEDLSGSIWDMGREDMDRVRVFRRSLGERTPTAHVTTARTLSSEQQGELARTLTALADRHVDIHMRVDPSLAAGMTVRLADIVVDNSITGRLEELREQASEALEDRLRDER